MAEVGPPPSADDKARYESLKNELKKALTKKRAVDKQLVQTETQIFTLESTYFAETAAHNGGNIVQGFENYLKNQTTGRRKNEINEHDRLFSRSSLTYVKSLDLANDGDESTATLDELSRSASGLPSASLTTVLLPPAPRTQELTASQQQKKLRDKEYQRAKRARMRGQRERDADAAGDEDSEDEIISAASTSSRRPTKRARLAEDD